MPDPSPRKKRKLTERQIEIRHAGMQVPRLIESELEWTSAGVGPYWRERSRLWRVALKAVKEAIR